MLLHIVLSCEHRPICVGVQKGRALDLHAQARRGSKISDMLRRRGVAAPGQRETVCCVWSPPHPVLCPPLPTENLSQVFCNRVHSDQTQCDRAAVTFWVFFGAAGKG